MKNRITIYKQNDTIAFYYHSQGKTFYLFTQKFSKGVYDYFSSGRSESEIRDYKRWNRNPRLDKTITKIPLYVRNVLKYESEWMLEEVGCYQVI